MSKKFTIPWPLRPRPQSRERKTSGGRRSTCAIISLLVGLLFLLKALMCAFFRAPIHDFVDLLIRQQFALTNDSMMTPLWMNPPVAPKLQVYLFNVTNSEEFLAGKEKLKVQEIGPYTYSAPQVKKVKEWSDDQNSITFQSKTTYTYLNDLKSDLHQDHDEIVVPNLVMMTGMLKSEVSELSNFLKQSVVWPILTSTKRKSPFIRLKVSEFLWGYEEELACLDTLDESESDYDPFSSFGDDFFAEEEDEHDYEYQNIESSDENKSFNSKSNFRRDDGKCMFGALVEKNDTWEKPVTMMTGGSGLVDKGRILSIGGSSMFNVWEKDSQCDQLSGTREPSALPPSENMDEFDMLMGIMCRSVRMVTATGKNTDKYVQKNVQNYSNSVTANRFTMSTLSFEVDSSDNRCFAPKEEERDLPNGIMSVAKCCEGSPLAVSSPHFLHADSWYREQVEGISPPNPELHELYIDLEPHLGALVGAQARFQVNLVVRRDPSFPPLANLNNTVTVIPLFWAQEGYNELPASVLQKLALALMLPNLFADGIIIFCVVIGVLLILWPILKGAKSIWTEQQMYKKYTVGTVNDVPCCDHRAAAVQTSTNSNTVNSSSCNKQSKNKTYNPLPFEDESQL